MQQSKQFILDRLPISLAPSEEAAIRRGSSHAGERIKIYSFTKLRVVRRGVARVVVEEENVVVYHCLDNTRYICIEYVVCVLVMTFFTTQGLSRRG